MRKILIAIALVAMASICRAETLCTDWGSFNLCVPITTGVETAYGYDFKGKQSQGLASTAFGYWNVNKLGKFDFQFGGVASEFNRGAPFIGVGYRSDADANPILSQVHFGAYGGRNWNDGINFYGLKAAIEFITPK